VDVALALSGPGPSSEPPLLTESELTDFLNQIESLRQSLQIRGINKSTARLQWVIRLCPQIGKVFIASNDVGEKIFHRLVELSQIPFEGDHGNPWDVPMAIYLWILGKTKTFRYLLPEAITKVRRCQGCSWAKEMADTWSKLVQ
jgi:hypothetical protein